MKEKVSKLTYPRLQHCLRMLYTMNCNSKNISDGQWDRKPVSSELHKIILAKVQKEYKLLLKKDQISVSCKNAYLQEILIHFFLSRNSALFELRNLTKMKDTTETVCQHNSSETAQQNLENY